MDSQWIEFAITAIESYRKAQKQFFKEEKNTKMNAIKQATQPKIQTTF